MKVSGFATKVVFWSRDRLINKFFWIKFWPGNSIVWESRLTKRVVRPEFHVVGEVWPKKLFNKTGQNVIGPKNLSEQKISKAKRTVLCSFKKRFFWRKGRLILRRSFDREKYLLTERFVPKLTKKIFEFYMKGLFYHKKWK
jgi:hypothetical protein